jgi:hypothetical protein
MGFDTLRVYEAGHLYDVELVLSRFGAAPLIA